MHQSPFSLGDPSSWRVEGGLGTRLDEQLTRTDLTTMVLGLWDAV